MAKILLTGGAGYIGTHTAVELLDAGYEAVVMDNFSNSCPEAVHRVEELCGKKIALYEADACSVQALDKIFSEQEIDGVIHFAGLKAVGESVEKPVEYYRNNLDSTLAILTSMQSHGVKNIIFSSSATVYGTPKQLPYVETMPTGGCTNPYGWTKLMSEQIISDAANADKTICAALLRYFNPVGAHKSGRIGEHPNGIPNNLMPYISQVAVGKREHLNVFGNDYPTRDGTGVRDYIHVVDLARGHVAALNYCTGRTGVHIFNLGTGRGYSVLELAETFSRVNNVPVPYVIAPRRDGDLAEYYADASLALKELGWKAELGLEDMCRDSWNWQKNNPNGYSK